MSLLERQLNPKDGNASGQTVTFSTLHSWRQRGCVSTEFTENEDTQEKSQEFGENSRFTGIVIGSEKERRKIIKKLSRVESDGILLIVPVQINGKMFSALIDRGATRCFVTQKCCTIAGLSCVPCDTFLELGNGTTALSRSKVHGAPITTASVTTRIDLTLSHLLHDVDIVLGVNWLKHVNPIIDWCNGRVYLPGAVHTALLEGKWLSSEHAIGTVKILSNPAELKDVQNDHVRNSLSILKTPKFWTLVNSRSNFLNGEVSEENKKKKESPRDCSNSGSKLFIQKDDCGYLYIKKLQNSAAIPKRATKDAAGYDIASVEETIVPAKGRTVVKTGLSIAIPDGCYGRIAPRSGLAVKKFIDIGAGVIDADYRGEIGVVMFSHSDEDLKVK